MSVESPVRFQTECKSLLIVIDWLFLILSLLLQVIRLENDNALLENKQKELKGTINNLLQSREYFVNAYEVVNFNGSPIFLHLEKRESSN